jgi:hypothetical protein
MVGRFVEGRFVGVPKGLYKKLNPLTACTHKSVYIYIHCITYRLKRKAATFVPYETNPPIPMNSVFFY